MAFRSTRSASVASSAGTVRPTRSIPGSSKYTTSAAAMPAVHTAHPPSDTVAPTYTATATAPSAAAASAAEAPKLKNDKGKLTELHGEPPIQIKRNENGILHRGKLLGEGGFARVYEATDSLNGESKAVKVISKEQLKSSKTKAKLFAEIKLHQVMDHPNIIKFECCFEDLENVYMQLELCDNNSMLDLLRRRRRFTEPETRYYLTQLIGAAQYMHGACVIHRDLKLGNLMLDDQMNLKVGDFGLAALVKFPGERKKTICGTPNYIAPEILFDQTTGHSFEADIWSIGVIVYTMIVGKPPFQTKDVKAIYKKIKQLEYVFPTNVPISDAAVDLIEAILDREPQNRPSASEILAHDFQYAGPFPRSIPPSAMDYAPDFKHISTSQSLKNYSHVQRETGASATATASTPAIPEESAFPDNEDADGMQTVPEPPASVVALSNGTSIGAQEVAIEKEVKKVLDPGSPISELLKSARKPLMVSPRALAAQREREKNDIARQAMLSGGRDRSGNMLSRPGTGDSKPSSPTKSRQTSAEGETGLENAVRALRVTSGVRTSPNKASAPVVTGAKRKLAASTASQFAVAAEVDPEQKITISSRDALEASLATLDRHCGTEPHPTGLEEPDTVAAPKVFVTAWIDYTHKYGTAYQLTDGSAGVYFNDSTTMIMAPGRQRFDYLSNRRGSSYTRRNHGIQSFPEELDRKVYLMTYFEDYMTKTLERDVEWVFSDKRRTRDMDFLIKYYRMKNAIVFHLSNDVIQFNFFDHTKILLTEQATVVTFIGPDYKLKSYPLAKLLRRAQRIGLLYGDGHILSSSDPAKQKTIDGLVFLFNKLEYCRDVLKNLCDKKKGSPVESV